MIHNILEEWIFENSWLKICFFKKKFISLQKDRFNLKIVFITFYFICCFWGGLVYSLFPLLYFYKLL